MKKIIMASFWGMTWALSLQAANFSVQGLSEDLKKDTIEQGIWKEGCPVHIDRLKEVHVSYYDFEGKSHDDGIMVVLDVTADDVKAIFADLYEKKFPLAMVAPINKFKGIDKASMDQNNTSAFNCRPTTDGKSYSLHSYGVALDFNTIQNPYVGNDKDYPVPTVLPLAGLDYVNRDKKRPGMFDLELAKIFRKHGFTIWGGDWTSPIDWQHFQPSRAVAEILAFLSVEDAVDFWAFYKKEYESLNKLPKDKTAILGDLYKAKGKKLLMKIKEHHKLLMTDVEKFMTEVAK